MQGTGEDPARPLLCSDRVEDRMQVILRVGTSVACVSLSKYQDNMSHSHFFSVVESPYRGTPDPFVSLS